MIVEYLSENVYAIVCPQSAHHLFEEGLKWNGVEQS